MYNPSKLTLLLGCSALLAGVNPTRAQQQITLPSALYLETFDQVQEGALPTGWSVQNFTDDATAGEDLSDPRSDSFKNWVVISRERVQEIGDLGAWEAPRRLTGPVGYAVNGVAVTNLISGNFAYAESDVRSGNQIQYLFSRDFDLSGKTSIYLSYHSIYEQNQDAIGAVEYSIDSGATWLPVVYMLDTPDVVKDASGAVDGYATLSAVKDDAAKYTDPVTGEEKGGFYGAFIGVQSNLWSTLGQYISPRIDNDSVESKRVELFRLTQADNQAKVRLRFAQAGTGSWYFGVDDVGLYSIQAAQPPVISQSPLSQSVSAGATVTLQVTATGAESYVWKLNGAVLAGQTQSTLTLANIASAQAGEYQVIVTGPGGSTPSAVAKVEVFTGAISQDLVAHLKFEDTLDDSSGKGNAGSPVGGPTFTPGKIGKAIHLAAAGDYVSLAAPTDLNFGTETSFSISMWAKLTEWSDDASLIGNKDWNSGGNQGYVLATDGDGRLQWNLAGSPGTRKDYDGPAGTFSDHNWHHVVVTFNRTGNAVSYVDGQAVNSTSLAASQNSLDTPDGYATNIGQDGTGSYGPSFTDADFDDVGVWRRSLTVQEVTAIYNAGLVGKDLTQATITAPAIAPTITTPPASVSAVTGGNATFTVTAAGSAPLTYQWKFNGTDLAGATASSLTVTNVQPANAGPYTVVVSNAGGTITSAAATLTVTAAEATTVTGQWDFDQGDLRATIGAPLEYRGDTAGLTTFSEMQIGGSTAKVMAFPAASIEQGFVMTHGATANGNGTNVNQYTLILDLFYAADSDAKWRGLLQTDPSNASDGDLFINGSNGLGISGQYQGVVSAATWHRVAAVFDLTTLTLKKYIDGELVNVQTLGSGVDQRWSLLPTALLFTDEDGETAAGYVNSIQFRRGLTSDADIKALGAPTASGIPQPSVQPAFTSVVKNANGSITVQWTGNGTLQAAATVAGPWQDVTGATSPYTLQATGTAMFARIKQ